ncbi:MAG: zeta toxin family protein [Limnohabitans sp.]|nr:zeta toxin family protein [Limnohabitans sp.]
MSKIKRLRIFAGPNGSGKSSLFEKFNEQFNAGTFINSDQIEKELNEKGYIDLSKFHINTNQEDLLLFLQTKNASSLLNKSKAENKPIDFYITENIIIDRPKNTHSYESALITSFIREKLIESNQSFCFETVMTHESKIEELIEAKKKGYKIYFYFICLDDPEVNISRVEDRVNKGGHAVDPKKIVSRYPKTLENLLTVLKIADKSFLIDNSVKMKLIAETANGNLTIREDENNLPNWFVEYVINKI